MMSKLKCSCIFFDFIRSALQEVLSEKPSFQCLKQDVVPYLVKSQLVGFSSNLFYPSIICYLGFFSYYQILMYFFVLMKHQRSELSSSGGRAEENGNENNVSQTDKVLLSQLVVNASTRSFHELYAMHPNGSTAVPRNSHKCCAYIASKSKYCARVDTVQAFCDINRDVSYCN